MKKIGFIDYYLDEWHAEQYPTWIQRATGGEMSVAYAYGKRDAEKGLDNATWCRNHEIELLDSSESVVEKSDSLIVLSPDNPEFHEELAMLPLQSGKPTYVDKTFAPDRRTALHLFETADRHRTPLFSASALRFATEYTSLEQQGIETICSIGPGKYDNYSIHQIEPIVSLMGSGAEQVMFVGSETTPALMIGFSGGRQATIHHFANSPFCMALNYDSDGSCSTFVKAESDYFAEFTKKMVQFFETGEPAVNSDETIAIVTLIEHGFKAARTPYQWLKLPPN